MLAAVALSATDSRVCFSFTQIFVVLFFVLQLLPVHIGFFLLKEDLVSKLRFSFHLLDVCKITGRDVSIVFIQTLDNMKL